MDESVIEACRDMYVKYRHQRRKQIDEGLHDYSLICSLLKASDEVRLHSRFISSMLNPEGLHYCGAMFLKAFLKQLPLDLEGFIQAENATVLREKNNIDLLIHDGSNYLIVENKLNASDQQYQITRYINEVRAHYFPEGDSNDEDIATKIAVVYLSRSRALPSAESQSIVGFDYDGQYLRWQGIEPDLLSKKYRETLSKLSLITCSAIRFVHYPYFPYVENWVAECLELAPNDARKLAFEEYQLVLNRLKKPGKWRKVMTLDSFALEQAEDKQKELYTFMTESQGALDNFIASKLYRVLSELLGEETLLVNEVTITTGERDKTTDKRYKTILYKPLSIGSIEKWLKRGGNKKDWRDTGFIISRGKEKQPVGFLLGVDYAYFGPFDEQGAIHADANGDRNRILGRKDVRNILLANQYGGLYGFIEEIERRARKCGLAKTEPEAV